MPVRHPFSIFSRLALGFLTFGLARISAQESLPLSVVRPADQEISAQMDRAWEVTWNVKSVLANLAKKTPEEMRMLGPDWRNVPEWKDQKGYPNPQWGHYREIWHLTREAGESALILLMVDPGSVSETQRAALRDLLGHFDYLHNSSCGIIYHLAAYWKARRHDVLARKL